MNILPVFADSAIINGRVTGITQQPLAGVNIYLQGTVLGAASNVQGKFQIKKVPPGSYRLVFSMVGFQQKDTSIVVDIDKLLNVGTIVLHETALQTTPIVVTAGKYQQSIQDVPLSISSISAREISYRNATRIDEALKYVSGVTMNRDQVNIRSSNGYSYGVGSRIMLLIDGIPYITGDSQSLMLESVPVNSIDRIEVQKGAGSSLYGSNALGGVINILTKPIPDEPQFGIRAYGGFYDRPHHNQWRWNEATRYLHGVHINYARQVDNLGLFIALTRDEDESYRQNDAGRRYNLTGKLQYEFTPFSRLILQGNYMDQRRDNFLYWQNLDNALVPAADQVGEKVKSQRYHLAAHYRSVFGNDQYLTTSAIWYHNRFEDNIGPEGNKSKSDYMNLDVQYHTNLSNNFVTIGFNPSYNQVTSDIFGTRDAYALAVYLQDEIKLNQEWQLSAGLRFDYFDIAELGSDHSFSPKAGAVHKPWDGTSFRASLGSGFRAPSMAEAFTSTAAGGLLVRPNPDLKAEQSISTEIGWNQFYSASLYSDVAVFYNYFWDLIEGGFAQSGDGREEYLQFTNVTEARVFGIEVNVYWQFLNDRLLYHGGYTYTNPQDITLGTDLKYRPRHIFYNEFKASLGLFDLGLDYRYLSRYESIDETFAAIIPDAGARVPVHVVDVRLAKDFDLEGKSLNISVQINNLLQYNYVDVVGTIAPIRNYVLTFDVQM